VVCHASGPPRYTIPAEQADRLLGNNEYRTCVCQNIGCEGRRGSSPRSLECRQPIRKPCQARFPKERWRKAEQKFVFFYGPPQLPLQMEIHTPTHLLCSLEDILSFFHRSQIAMSRIWVILVASALLSVGVAQQTCYFPNGKIASGLIPCNKASNATHCCRAADRCLTNGLCFSPGLNSIVKRGCTDPTWNVSQCPSYCNASKFLGDFCVKLSQQSMYSHQYA
jgi:hypothetical protein